MQDWLSAQAYARPDGIALICDDETLTYRELDTRAAHVAAWLVGQGVQRGERVALLPANDVESVAAIHAVARLGATLVLLNTRLTTSEIEAQIERVKPRVVLQTPLQMTGFRNVLVAKRKGFKKLVISNPGEIDLNDDACILFTSGTSGVPKAAVLTWSNFWHSALASAYRIGTLPTDRWLCTLPLFHVGGLSIILRACLYGIAVDLRHKFDAPTIHAALASEPITLISLVPTMLYRLLDARDKQPAQYPSLRLVLLGGAAADDELMHRALAATIPIATTYGLTEATSQVCTALPEDAARKPNSVGKPLPFAQVRVVDADDNDLPRGDIGEVIVRGPTVMRCYLDDDEATRRVLKDGWLHTGDMGYLDEDGDLFIVQRRSDLIVSGGENVYPAEVEGVLRQHPAVADCLVVGIDSAEWGQQVAALVVARLPVSERELNEFVRARIAAYKVPRVISFVDALPMTASGKPDRVVARTALTPTLTGKFRLSLRERE